MENFDDDRSFGHFEFLASTPNSDENVDYIRNTLPEIRIHFLNQLLLDIGDHGSILVYSSYEKTRLRELAIDFPEYKGGIDAVISRLVDLAEPFRKKHYYHHKMQGSYSIKYVLPALVPELSSSYSDLEIGSGDKASTIFHELLTGTFQGNNITARENLLTYCQLDTWAMVKILHVLICCCNEYFGDSESLETDTQEVGQTEIGNSVSSPVDGTEIQLEVSMKSDGSFDEQRNVDKYQNMQSQLRLSDIAQNVQEGNDVFVSSVPYQTGSLDIDDHNLDMLTIEKEVFMLHKDINFDEKYANVMSRNLEADIVVQGDRVHLKFRFNWTVIEAIKRYISSRSYDPVTKSWTCPLTSLNTAVKLYAHMGRVVTVDMSPLPPSVISRSDRVVKIVIHFLIAENGENIISNSRDVAAIAIVTFDFDAEIVTALKELDPYYRSYHPSKKEWRINCILLSELMEKLNTLGYNCVTQQQLSEERKFS